MTTMMMTSATNTTPMMIMPTVTVDDEVEASVTAGLGLLDVVLFLNEDNIILP